MSVPMRRSSSSLLCRRPSFKDALEAVRADEDPCLTVNIDHQAPTLAGSRASDRESESFVEFMRRQQMQTRVASPISWQKWKENRDNNNDTVPGLVTFLRYFFLYLHEPFLQTGIKPVDESFDEYYW
jgi:hypothetical protein